MAERVDRRILGLVRPVDAVTGQPVAHALEVRGAGLRLFRVRSGGYAITGAEGLEDHIVAFDEPPDQPPAESLEFTLTLDDPTRRFLPRTVEIALPRPWDPENGVRDLLDPILVPMAPAASLAMAPAWAVVEASVSDTDAAPIRGAMVEIFPAGGGPRLSWGLTHARGEARVAVPGLPAFREVENDPDTEDDDEIVTAVTSVDVRVTADPGRPWPVDPSVIALGGGNLRRTTLADLQITPGQAARAPITLDLS